MCPAPARGNAEFPTPTVDDALDVALSTFEAGERLDMAGIAARLGVGRSTLYRWVGDRDALLDRVVAVTMAQVDSSSQRRLRGSGVDRVVNAMRAHVEAAAGFVPLQALAEREPAVALHAVLNPHGAFARQLDERLRRSVADSLPDAQVPDDVLAALTDTLLALVWASLAGEGPQTDRALRVVRTVLSAHGA